MWGGSSCPTSTGRPRPSWLYRLNQGLHVGLGLVVIPVVLAKLWSVIPRLFAWPPARSVAQVLERVTLLMLVGGILFEIVTGVLNIQYDYIFGFSFYTAHYFGAWVFIAAFVSHVCLKLPTMVRGLRSRSLRSVLAHLGGRHGARTARPRRAGGTRPRSAHPEPPRRAGRCGRRHVAGGGAHRRANPGRVHPQCGAVAAPWPQLRQGTQRLSDQPHRRCGRHRPRRHRRPVAPAAAAAAPSR